METEMRKTSVKMDKPIVVGQAILNKSKVLMYKFYYDYLKPKYNDEVKLLYMDRDSFVLYIETEDFFEDIKNDIHDWYDTSKYMKLLNLPLEYGANKKKIGKMKDEWFDGFMKEFIAKDQRYMDLVNSNMMDQWNKNETKKANGTNRYVTDKNLNFDHLKRCLFNNDTIRCIQHRFKSKPGLINTIEKYKIVLKNKDNKRLRTFDGITTYPIGTSAFKVCKSEM